MYRTGSEGEASGERPMSRSPYLSRTQSVNPVVGAWKAVELIAGDLLQDSDEYSALKSQRDVQQISRDKLDGFPAQPPDLRFASLIDMGFRDHWPARPTLTLRSGFVHWLGFCSTLPSDPASRRRPCASLSLHLYQVVKRTYTSQLSNMRGRTNKKHGTFVPWLFASGCGQAGRSDIG